MKESCRNVRTHMKGSCHTYMLFLGVTYAHTYINESCHRYERVLWHVSTCHVKYMNESCHTCEPVMLCRWVMSHARTHHVIPVKKSWHTYERVTSHLWATYLIHVNENATQRRHVTHINDSYHTNEFSLKHQRAMVHRWITSAFTWVTQSTSHKWFFLCKSHTKHVTQINKTCRALYEGDLSHM